MALNRPITMVFFVFPLLLLSCSVGKQNQGNANLEETIEKREITVEAYLFDVKLRRQGKPTTLRLDLYQTDSVIAMFGRGYFNKGAFRGRLTKDSMLVYFPSTKEYLQESMESLFQSFDCEKELIAVQLLGYFSSPPDSGHISQDLNVEKIKQEGKRRQLKVTSANCPWQLLLGYQMKEKGWRIEEFEFDDGESVTLKGSQRRYKESTSVPASRMNLAIPTNFNRLTL